ncbi:MAG: hypothetical protein JO051_15295 [Acidobacteriaceae bacterium]|nr:hypothetical protein [Acidobacteriaceae bacterium]
MSKARETNEEIYANLHSFVCDESVQRFRGSFSDEKGQQIDTLRATVSFENDIEHYSKIRQNAVVRPSMSSIDGAWSEGEFGSLLRQTELLLSTHLPVFEGFVNVAGKRAAVFKLEVDANNSRWDLKVLSQHHAVPFRTTIWVSQARGEILKIERTSTNIPFQVGISEVRWNITLKEVHLHGKTWLLPSTGEYVISYQASRHREWNVMSFSNYRRYGSEVAILFR